jgi:hypothetical protein
LISKAFVADSIFGRDSAAKPSSPRRVDREYLKFLRKRCESVSMELGVEIFGAKSWRK